MSDVTSSSRAEAPPGRSARRSSLAWLIPAFVTAASLVVVILAAVM